MKFRYLVSIDSSEGRIYEGTAMELDEATATSHAGKKFNHLEPLDKDAKAFLDRMSGKTSEPTRDELIEQARVKGVKGAVQMKKSDLVEALGKA